MTGPVAYCYGQRAADAKPKLYQASDFDHFVAQILDLPRARSKTDRSYICGPMRPNGGGELHRCKADLLPRAWLAHDLDGGDRDEVEILLMRLADYRAVAWQTARSTPECPRWRILVHLDREVDGPDGERLGAAFVGVVGAGLPSLKWDRSTHKGEQACYLPMQGAQVTHYHGDAVDVDAVLALALVPEGPTRERPATRDPYRGLVIERGLFLRKIGPGKDAVTCPFKAEHTPEPPGSRAGTDTSTVYLWPLYGGYRRGRIHCSHSHCSSRQQEDFIRALGVADPGAVWGVAAPYDDMPPVEAYYDAAQESAWLRTAGTRTTMGGDPDPPNGSPSYPAIPPLGALRIDPDDLGTARLTPTCVVESYLYADVAVLAGPGGTGKTTLALWEAVHIALGRPLYGLTVHTPGNVVLVTAEDRRELLIARLLRIMEAMGLSEEEQRRVCAAMLVWDVAGTVCRLAELDRQGNVVLTGLADAIVERFQEAPPVMVGLDPAISFGAGERIVNDNEQALITAARRIVRGLGCCVRLIAHTGKETARAGLMDQYASRGGSALSDGARMVAVLRSWDPEADDKLSPPPGLSFGIDEHVIVLGRPKLSYVPPQPLFWITRRGYAFQHFIATRPDPEAEARARADQLELYLIAELTAGSRYTRNTLKDTGVIKPRDKLRAALSALESAGRVVDAPNPATAHSHGGARTYLHPIAFGSPRGDGEANENAAENGVLLRDQDPPLAWSLAYREKNGGEPKPPNFSPLPPRFAGEAPRSNGEASEASEVGDIQRRDEEPLP